MLTDGFLTAYRVRAMNVFTLNPASTAPHGTASSGSSEPLGREKAMDSLPGRRMKWPFSVAASSVGRARVNLDAGMDCSNDSDLVRFVT